MQKRIAIIEDGFHNEVVWAIVQVCLELAPEVHVYCNKQVYTDLYDLHDNDRIQWHRSNLPVVSYLKNASDNFYSSTIFSTVLPRHFRTVIARGSIANSVFISHGLNYFFPHRSLWNVNGVKSMLQLIKHVTLSQSGVFHRFLRCFSAVGLPNEELVEEYKLKSSTKQLPPATIIPFLVSMNKNENKTPMTSKDSWKIVVPGAVRQQSRNYIDILECLPFLKIKQSVDLIFLGELDRPHEFEMINSIKNNAPSNITVSTFDHFVTQKDYDMIINEADLLVLPLNAYLFNTPIKERFGKTAVSGNLHDVIKYQKPALISGRYHLPANLHSYIQRYGSAKELGSKVTSFLNAEPADLQYAAFTQAEIARRIVLPE